MRGGTLLSCRVLLIDFEFDCLDRMISELQRQGLVCRTTNSYQRGIDLLKQDSQIKFVVANKVVNKKSMRDFTKAARLVRPGLVVVVTGDDTDQDMDEMGVDHVLVEPWTPSDLLHELKRERSDTCSIAASETRLGLSASDTTIQNVAVGDRVRVTAGAMEGLTGHVVSQRHSGRLLVRIGLGLLIEIDQFSVEPRPTVIRHDWEDH